VHCFSSKKSFDNHFPACSKHQRQIVKFPDIEKGKNILSWRSRSKTELYPFVIYCDFEAYLQPVESNLTSKTQAVSEHIASGFCCYCVSTEARYQNAPFLYSGEDCMEIFFDHLCVEQQRISCILATNYEMLPLSRDQQLIFDNALCCHKCLHVFTVDNVKCRHHDHSTGLFKQAVCNSCNLQLKTKFKRRRKDAWRPLTNLKYCCIDDNDSFAADEFNFEQSDSEDEDEDFKVHIPVIFHNLAGYDSHLIIKNFNSRVLNMFDPHDPNKRENVEIIGLNLEKFISFDILNFRFIDSFKFLNSSLSSLVENLTKSCDTMFDKFVHTLKNLGCNELLFSKGIFPYEFFNSLEKFKEPCLPPREAFYSQLNEQELSVEDYAKAQKIWDAFGCTCFKHFHDHYLTTDVFLLADVFEHFRKLSIEFYGLDPAQYLTLPSLSWDAMLKFTNINLQLFTDPEMHSFIESSIRGGVATISHRFARANNPYLRAEEFNCAEANSYIAYFDINNLYGFALADILPTGNFSFLNAEQIDSLDLLKVSTDGPTGYIVECDLHYSSSLHDIHNDYPLAAESLIVTKEMTSDFYKQFTDFKHVDCRKLIPNLNDKSRYVTHLKNLQLYVRLGLKLTKVHRVLSFSQSNWMQPYIEFNTMKRKLATDEFGKNFFKLMNNSVYGKSIENVRNRKLIQMVNDEKKLLKIIAKPQLEQFKIINSETVLVDRIRQEVTLDKPIYVGFTVLELSKVAMYKFHYDVIVSKYKSDARLLFTDTDSLCYHIKTDDLYRDLLPLNDEYFDTSGYDPAHFLYSKKNAKTMGLMKDECNGIAPLEFVGLRAKMYSLLVSNTLPSKRTAKGIKKGFIDLHLRHELYLQTLNNKVSTHAQFLNFRSRSHKIETVKFDKICLNSYDDKRFVLNDGIHTLAYGHYLIKQQLM
jgi:hypothetical protein